MSKRSHILSWMRGLTLGALLLALIGCGESTTAPKTTGAESGAGEAAPPAAEAPAAREGIAAPALPAAHIELPAPPALADPQLLGMVRVREPNQVLDRLGAWAELFQPGMNAAALRTQFQMQSGIDPTQMTPGGNLATYIWAPPREMPGPPTVGAIVPVAAISPTSPYAADSAAHGDYSSVGLGPQGLQAVEQNVEALHAAAQAPTAADVELMANVTEILDIYGDQLRSMTQMAGGMLMMSGDPNAQRFAPILQAELTALVDFLEKLARAMITIDFDPAHLELGLFFQAEADSGLFDAGAVEQRDLMALLPADSPVRVQMTLTDPRAFAETYAKYIKLAFPGVTVQQSAQIDQLVEDLGQFDQMVFAQSLRLESTSGSQGPQPKMIVHSVIEVDDAEALMEFVREKITIINEGMLHDLYTSMGMTMTISPEPEVREVEGVSVDHYALKVDVDETMFPAEEAARMEAMVGDLSFDVARFGDLVLYSMGAPIDGFLTSLKQTVAVTPSQSMQAFQGGGIFYGEVNPAALLEMLRAVMPADQAAQIPAINPDTPSLLMAGFHRDQKAYYRLRAPRALLETLRTQPATDDLTTGGDAPPLGEPAE